jgi:hypothetical protein
MTLSTVVVVNTDGTLKGATRMTLGLSAAEVLRLLRYPQSRSPPESDRLIPFIGNFIPRPPP